MSYIHPPIDECPPWLIIPKYQIKGASYARSYDNCMRIIEKLMVHPSYSVPFVKIARDFVKNINHEGKTILIYFRDGDDEICLECGGYCWEWVI